MKLHILGALASAVVLCAPAAAQQPQEPTREQAQQQTQQRERGQQRAQQQNARPDRGRQQAQGSQQAAETRQRLEASTPSTIAGQQPVQAVLVASAQRIVADPAHFYGVQVSVHGDVASAESPHLFTIDDDAWLQFEDLPVIVRRPTGAANLEEGDFVTVIGTVRPFIRAELEREYDWFDALPETEVELEGRPVIVADIARTSEGAVLAEPNRPVTHVLVADAGEIADLPGRFYGHIVSVRSEVEDVWSGRAFTLDEDEWSAGTDVAVFNPSPAGADREASELVEEDVTVVGVVRPFVVAEFEEDYEWFDASAYDPRELEEIERRPVIVASSVRDDGRELVRFHPELALDEVEARVASRAQRWPESLARAERAESQRLARQRQQQRPMQGGSPG